MVHKSITEKKKKKKTVEKKEEEKRHIFVVGGVYMRPSCIFKTVKFVNHVMSKH